MDSRTSKMVFFLIVFIFVYSLSAAGMMYTFAGGPEPTSGSSGLPPQPSGANWWEQLGFVGTIATYLIGLATGFSTFGVPPPISWVLAGFWWCVCIALVFLIFRG